MQRYLGHEMLSRTLEATARECAGGQRAEEEEISVSCLLSGDRRLRIVLSREGELSVKTVFSPRFLVILLPQAGLPISPSNMESGPLESPASCPRPLVP
ncbi:MAG: hypothetical protein FJ109_22175 [Deltaproteobacteria bacterium]|nr:hypothetical protein [Deltaproteobacteria bacterium]